MGKRALRLYAEMEHAFSNAKVKTVRRAHRLGALADLLHPVTFLQQFGSSEELSEKIATVKAAADIMRDLPGIMTGEHEAIAEVFHGSWNRLHRYLDDACKVEDQLVPDGCRRIPLLL